MDAVDYDLLTVCLNKLCKYKWKPSLWQWFLALGWQCTCADHSVLTPTDIAGGQSEFMFSTATLYKCLMFPLIKGVVFVFDHSVQICYIIEHWLSVIFIVLIYEIAIIKL